MNTLSVSARRLGLRAALRSRRIAPLRTYATPVPVVEESNDMPPEDYPDVPFVPKQRRPARGWEDPQMRRNFGEPLHETEEVISMWGPDAPVVPPNVALRQFTLAFLGFVGFGFAVQYAFVIDRPSVPREYPYGGLVTELGGLEENKARPESESADEE